MRAEEGREGERREEKRPLSCLLFSFASLSLSLSFFEGRLSQFRKFAAACKKVSGKKWKEEFLRRGKTQEMGGVGCSNFQENFLDKLVY